MAQAQLEREPGEPGRRVLPLRRLGEGLAPSRLAPAPFEDAEASRLSPLDRDDRRRAPRLTSVAEGRRWNTGRGGPEGAAGTRQRRHFEPYAPFGVLSATTARPMRRRQDGRLGARGPAEGAGADGSDQTETRHWLSAIPERVHTQRECDGWTRIRAVRDAWED
jgi:hypothetical protein